MTEGIKIYCRFRLYAEFIKEIIFSRENLAHKALARGEIAIGLEIPAAHDMPFALAYKLLYAGEKMRVVFLYPFIKHGFIMAENKPVIIIAEICGNTEGGKRLGYALLYFPEPYGVDMCITDKMKIIQIGITFQNIF